MSMLALLLRIKLRLQQLLHLPEAPALLPWASLAGLVGALATIAFREALDGLQWLILGRSGSLVEIAQMLPWPTRIALPTAGGIVAGMLLSWASRRPSSGAADYMDAIARDDGRISGSQTLLRSGSSLCTIASGGSIGREGAMVQLAAMCASFIGRFVHFDAARLRLLVACGAAAGITSAYNAPIASAFFISEIVLGSIVMESFGPVAVAAVVANITMREFPGYRPTYEMPAFPSIPYAEIVAFVVLGAIAGLSAPYFLRLLEASRTRFRGMNLSLPVRFGLGGLVVGILSVWAPEVWGNGYDVVNSMLHQPWIWSAVLAVLICKIAATAATVGSGAVGGVFTPALFVGAATGYLFGLGMHELWPHAASMPSAYAVIGMGAFLAGATTAPLMAILMIFEMTLSYQIMLPLTLSCVAAYYIARSIEGTPMYEITARRLEEEKAKMKLRATQMRDLIRPAKTVVPLGATFQEMTKMFLEYPVKYLYVVDTESRFQGVVALQDLTSALLNKPERDSCRASDFLRRNFLPLVAPGMSLEEALRCFMTHQGERLPVVESADDPKLLGVVDKTSLLDAYFRLNR